MKIDSEINVKLYSYQDVKKYFLPRRERLWYFKKNNVFYIFWLQKYDGIFLRKIKALSRKKRKAETVCQLPGEKNVTVKMTSCQPGPNKVKLN